MKTNRTERAQCGSALLATALAMAAVGWAWVGRDRSHAMPQRLGAVARTDVEIEPDRGDGYLRRTVRLRTTDGTPLRMRVLSPHSAAGADDLPAVLIVGGHRTAADAIDLIPDPGGIAVAAMDYPYFGSHKPKGLRQGLATIPAIRRAALDTPAALGLGLAWLRRQPEIKADRVELVGASLGAPFAIPAAALDGKLPRVWILQGGGDLPRWLDASLVEKVPHPSLRAVTVALGLQLVGARSFEAHRHFARLGEARVVVIGSRDDERVPAECTAALVRDSGGRAQVEWAPGLHFSPSRPEVVAEMFGRVAGRILSGVETHR